MAEINQKTDWEKVKCVLTPIFTGEQTPGILMAVSVIVALILANFGWAEQLHEFWEYPLSIYLKELELSLTLHEFVNDGLMAIFFFIIGLEIKREIIAGELSNINRQCCLYCVLWAGLFFRPLYTCT